VGFRLRRSFRVMPGIRLNLKVDVHTKPSAPTEGAVAAPELGEKRQREDRRLAPIVLVIVALMIVAVFLWATFA